MIYIIILIALLIAFWFSWRLYSNRHTLPCPAWLAWMVELDNPFAKAHKAKEIINILPLKNGVRILDIGCGPGRVLLPLAKQISTMGGHVTGLDIQAEMVEKTKIKAKELSLANVDFIISPIDQAKIKANYDIVIMICVLGEIPKNQHNAILFKIAEFLLPGGIISVTETIFDPHFQSHTYVNMIMNMAGFVETKFKGNMLAYTAHFKKAS